MRDFMVVDPVPPEELGKVLQRMDDEGFELLSHTIYAKAAPVKVQGPGEPPFRSQAYFHMIFTREAAAPGPRLLRGEENGKT